MGGPAAGSGSHNSDFFSAVPLRGVQRVRIENSLVSEPPELPKYTRPEEVCPSYRSAPACGVQLTSVLMGCTGRCKPMKTNQPVRLIPHSPYLMLGYGHSKWMVSSFVS